MGAECFRTCDPAILERLPVRTIDKEILSGTGLPVFPEESLRLSMRFEVVNIVHEPNRIRLLTDCEIEKGAHFPKSDHWLNFMRHDFAKLLLLEKLQTLLRKVAASTSIGMCASMVGAMAFTGFLLKSEAVVTFSAC